ncbi:ComF family protein [Robertmurraya korlensis]|uniref:ComF family protein n=1 Tax=Robertmurraya korlensis TaxID=519977 RepID=UPI003528F9C6
MKCLYCGEMIILAIGWTNLLSREDEVLLCDQCTKQLVPIEGEVCARCSRPFEGLAEEFQKGELCYDCVRWEEHAEWNGVLERNISLYIYNDFLKEVISRYKFRGDYEISKFFGNELKRVIKNLEYDFLVPIPLSETRLYERGFNQAEALIVEAGLNHANVLNRNHSKKQSKKTRKERIGSDNVFIFSNIEQVLGKKVVLVDDVYTTGSTIMHAARVLKDHGAYSISSITFAR